MSKAGAKLSSEQVEVVLNADFLPQSCVVGTLFHTAGHGAGVFSFAYEKGRSRDRPLSFWWSRSGSN